jgi:hypothetical protein
MKRFCDFCTKAKIVAAETAGTVVFFVMVYVAMRYEILHLLK